MAKILWTLSQKTLNMLLSLVLLCEDEGELLCEDGAYLICM